MSLPTLWPNVSKQSAIQSITHRFDGAYEVTFAYPSSSSAVKTGFAKTGCFVLRTETGSAGFVHEAGALRAAKETNLACGRWSIDHPLNSKLRYSPAAPYCLAFNPGQDGQFEAGSYMTLKQALIAKKLFADDSDVMMRLPDGSVTTEF